MISILRRINNRTGNSRTLFSILITVSVTDVPFFFS